MGISAFALWSGFFIVFLALITPCILIYLILPKNDSYRLVVGIIVYPIYLYVFFDVFFGNMVYDIIKDGLFLLGIPYPFVIAIFILYIILTVILSGLLYLVNFFLESKVAKYTNNSKAHESNRNIEILISLFIFLVIVGLALSG